MTQIMFRKKQLRGLLSFLTECEAQIIEALHADLGKPVFESRAVELAPLKAEIKDILSKLDSWTTPQFVSTPLIHQPGKSWISFEPLGKVLVIAPWNYPIQLNLLPAASAIGSGNQVTLKPSELAPACSHILAHRLPNYAEIHVAQGGVAEAEHLLTQHWDHIVFTGSTRVGRIVMQAAAKNLTPVTLELGGKCPVIVEPDACLKTAARRIIWGKMLNAGQTCVAPDHLFVHESVKEKIISLMKKTIQEFFGDNPSTSPHFGRIINDAHLTRLKGLLENTQIIHGGDIKSNERYVDPTLILDPGSEHALMQEEIFGPILPIIPYQNFDDVIQQINSRPNPLAIYLFTRNSKNRQKISEFTRSGAVCINEVVTYVGIPELPFGGVGSSGFGAYNGRFGFERFSHPRAYYQRSANIDLPLRYPPYSQLGIKIASWI